MLCKSPRTGSSKLSFAILAASVLCAGNAPVSAAGKRDAPQEEVAANSIAGTPVMAIVSLASQHVTLYDAQGGALRAPVSSGQTDYETPVGIFAVLQKEEEHYSNLYDDASMPFMQRITWSGIALHAGQLPGYPASHGCIRMPLSFAERIFPMTKMGMRVIVARDDVAPVSIAHPLLFKPKPVGSGEIAIATHTAYSPEAEEGRNALLPDVESWPARQKQLETLKSIAAAKSTEAAAATEHAKPFQAELKQKTLEKNKVVKKVRAAEVSKTKAESRVARVDKWLAEAKKPNDIKSAEEAKAKAAQALAAAEAQLAVANAAAQPAIDAHAKATEEANTAEAARVAAVNAAKEAERKMLPVSVFVSLKTQRLYLRQGFEPVLESPVTIQNPDQPIGTHIYTALAYADGGNDVRWSAVSLARRSDVANDATEDEWNPRPRKKQKTDSNAQTPPTDLNAAKAALDRVTIPPEILTRVSENVWPGSSLIISDEAMHKETGKATDFVVVMSGEPQGALKKRRRPPDNFYPYDPYFYPYDRGSRRPNRGPGKYLWW